MLQCPPGVRPSSTYPLLSIKNSPQGPAPLASLPRSASATHTSRCSPDTHRLGPILPPRPLHRQCLPSLMLPHTTPAPPCLEPLIQEMGGTFLNIRLTPLSTSSPQVSVHL